MSFLRDSEHNLRRIPLQDIIEATRNFETIIGRGGYGPVYKGEISISGNLTSVAIKRLIITNSGQGLKEFMTEINLLAHYKHANLVSLFGYCEEGNEKILNYEYADGGSFDNYLRTVPCQLTWKQRISICIDAARGLDYLHNHVGEHHRIIHRDIKSSNILLFGDSRKAKIADLGLSKIGRVDNETYIISNPAGTHGYCDPVYMSTGVLSKKSDVFSFGVVLFEALSGRLSFMNVIGTQTQLVTFAQQCYKEGNLNEITSPDLKDSKDQSIKEFSKIAHQCVHVDPEERPSMDEVLQKLETALEMNEQYEEAECEFQKLVKTLQMLELDDASERHTENATIRAIHMMSGTPPTYTTKEEIYRLLSYGILIDDGKVWFSKDENGKNQEMISAKKFMYPANKYKWKGGGNSDGGGTSALSVADIPYASEVNLQVKIKTQFLSSNVSYAAYIVCKHEDDGSKLRSIHALKYKLNNQRQSYISYPRHYHNTDGWGMIELFQTKSRKRKFEFEVLLEEFQLSSATDRVLVQSILFLPIQKVDDEQLKSQETENPQMYEIGIGWENRLPNDYEKFVYYSDKKLEKKSLNYIITETKEQAYTMLSRGVYIKTDYDVDVWFWITKSNGKKCFMLSPKSNSIKIRVDDKQSDLSHSNESRFKYVLETRSSQEIYMEFNITACLLSANTGYGCYLVYKIPQGFDNRPVYAEIHRFILGLTEKYKGSSAEFCDKGILYLSSSSQRTVVIGPDGTAEFSPTPSTTITNKLPIAQLPSKRKDGWLEVRLFEFTAYNDLSIQNICPRWSSADDQDDSFTKFPTFHAGYDHKFSMKLTCNYGRRAKGAGITIPDLSVQGVEFRPL